MVLFLPFEMARAVNIPDFGLVLKIEPVGR